LFLKETNVKEQELIIDKYKVNHRRRFLWHRIVSVLSAIMVFCATYVLLLPAFTMEDPTVGVKLSNQYTYENENLSAVFTVTGRAIFKEENIEIENPQAEFVDLNVVVLEKEDRAYKAYAEYASDSIGEEELANIMAFELKFTYMGHELDMKKCDIVAEINAKEVFFTDDFGTEYDGAVYVADPAHPMADKNTESSAPAMAFTAIQGTSFNIYDAPTVYTTDVEEVSTLTVDVKGDTLALLTSVTSNPTFTVEYYAIINPINTTTQTNASYKQLDVIDTRNDKGLPTNGSTLSMTSIYLNPTTAAQNAGKNYEVLLDRKLVKIYKTKTFTFAEAPGYEYVDRLAANGNYKLTDIRKFNNPDGETENSPLGDWLRYDPAGAVKPSFTNNSALADSDASKIYIEEGTVIRMVYQDSGANNVFGDNITLFDYDISNGKYSDKNGTEKATSTQSTTSTAYIKTTTEGVNKFTATTGKYRFAFGSINAYTGLDNVLWNGSYINYQQTFGMVTGVEVSEDDFVPVFHSDITAPDIFSNSNEHDPAGNTSTTLTGASSLVANYVASDNVKTGTVDKDSLVWKDLSGTQADITVTKDANNYFTGNSYKTNGGKYYLPIGVTEQISNIDKFSLELVFGDVREAGSAPILLSDESGTNLLKLCIDNSGFLCLYKNGSRVIRVANGFDLVSYSTITIVHAKTESKLYLYCDGVRIAEASTLLTANFNLGNNRLCFGTFDTSAASQHSTEYKSIRLYAGILGPKGVATNATVNKTRSNRAGESGAVLDGHSTGGKTVIGGRVVEFKRNGDTYTLSAVRNGTSDLENLEYFSSYSNEFGKSESNDFWPLDYSGTFGTNGHDIVFGSSSYWGIRRAYGLLTIADLNGRWPQVNNLEPATGGNPAQWAAQALPIADDNKDHNSYFGMKYKVDFSIDKDYCGPLEYFFYGDDDLWVFLDDQLVCDIGGIHSSIGQIVDLWDYLPDTGYEGDHTLYMFYLERGASGSSCYMQFTLPSVSVNAPQQTTTSLSLEKTLRNSDTTADFEFDVELYDTNGVLLTNNYSYAIFDADGLETGETGTIVAGKGTVQLKGGEKILVNFLPVGTKYKITENEDVFFTSYSVNGETAVEGKSVEGALDIATSVVFINTAGDKLPSTGVLGGGMSVIIYYIPLGIATVYMCAMPIINRPKKTKK